MICACDRPLLEANRCVKCGKAIDDRDRAAGDRLEWLARAFLAIPHDQALTMLRAETLNRLSGTIIDLAA